MSFECDLLDTYDDDDNSGCESGYESEVPRPSSSASIYSDSPNSTTYYNDSTTYRNEMGLLNPSCLLYRDQSLPARPAHIMANI